MAVYLKDYLKKFAKEKGLDWPGSRDDVVWKANGILERDKGKLDEVWKDIEDNFHSDIVQEKISKYDLESVKKKIRQAL